MIGRARRGGLTGVILVAAGLLVLASAPVALGADRVYWANTTGTISYANLDGSGGAELNISGATPNGPRGVAIDAAAGRIYWANQGNDTISYAKLDGSGGGGQLDISGATANRPHGLAIDPASGRVFWATRGASTGLFTIAFANLDGSGGGAELDISGATANKPHGVMIDAAGGRIYWTNLDSTIWFANLDGSGGGGQFNTSGATDRGGIGMAIDPLEGRLYWGNLGNDTISFANLDLSGGGGQLDISGTTPDQPRFVALLRAPSGAGAPQIAGGSIAGSVLTCSQGEWAPDLLGSFFYRAPQRIAYQWSRDGAEIDGATDASYTAAVSGHYRCRVTATNEAGSTSQTSDPHAVSGSPDTTITKGPKNKTREKRRTTFQFSATEPGSAFECSLNGASFASCASPLTVRGKNGKNHFEVRAENGAGAVDATPATFDWKVKKKQ